MAILETRKKIHFVPFDIKKGRDVDTSDAPTITIANGSMRFSKRAMSELNLDKKFVKFFYDRIKSVIGFQVRDTIKDTGLQSLRGEGKWKLVKMNETTGMWTISIKKMMLSQFGEKSVKTKYSKLPLQKYREMSDVMGRGEIYYFVELVDEAEEETDNV